MKNLLVAFGLSLTVAQAQVPTPINYSVSFIPTNQWVSVGTRLFFETNQAWTATCSINVGIKPPGGGASLIFGNCHSVPFAGYELWIDEFGRLRVRIISNFLQTNYVGVIGTTDVTDGNWHWVGATYDGTSQASGVKMYVDGTQEATSVEVNALTGSIIGGSHGPLLIGSQFNYEDQYNLKGLMDDFALSTTNFPAGYFSSYSYTNPPPTNSQSVLFYNFDEGVGTSTLDYSTNKFFGVLTTNNMWTTGAYIYPNNPFTMIRPIRTLSILFK